MTGFATITRPGLEIAAGETEQLDLVMEVGGLVEQTYVVVSPREVYRRAAAVVHLRVVESLGVALKDGFPTTEQRVAIVAVIKPHEEKERPAWRSPPPNDRIVGGNSFTALQRDSGTVAYRDRLATGKRTPVQAGEEYVAFLEDSSTDGPTQRQETRHPTAASRDDSGREDRRGNRLLPSRTSVGRILGVSASET